MTEQEKLFECFQMWMKTKQQPEEPTTTTRRFKSYRDDEVEQVLSMSPTEGNFINLAEQLSRSVNALKYMWKIALSPRVRKDDKYHQQVKRVAKRLGLMTFSKVVVTAEIDHRGETLEDK